MSDRLSRRALLFTGSQLHLAAAPKIRREIFLTSTVKGVAVMAFAFYTRNRGGDMISIDTRWSRSDTVDVAYVRRSQDHGRTWAEPTEMRTHEKHPQGVLRRHPHVGFAGTASRYVYFWTEGLLAGDDPLEGLRQWNVYYRISEDGGRTLGPSTQIIHTGEEFHAGHPVPGVWTGKNCVMSGDRSCVPIAASDGHILLPVQITPLAPDDSLYNPRGTYTYTEAAVLHGRWKVDILQWQMSDLVRGDPSRSTRGMDEPTIEHLEGGRLLMVLRGSNDRHPDLPSYRWFSLSLDGGYRWSPPQPWSYDDGQTFFSPSACSQLVRHSSGRLFWFGNITPDNPRGNRPRYPFVIGEVNRQNGLLMRSTVQTIDNLQPGEDSILSLSNTLVRTARAKNWWFT